MYENYDFYKALQFLKRTRQPDCIVKGVTGQLVYMELDVLEMIEKKKFLNYFMIEKLYCKIMQDMDYNVPFTLNELMWCIAYYPKKQQKLYNDKVYEYVDNLYKRLLVLYP